MSTSEFNPRTHTRLGSLEVDTEFKYKGVRYAVTGRSKWYRINYTTGSVQIRRVDNVLPVNRRKRWTLLARTAILNTEIF